MLRISASSRKETAGNLQRSVPERDGPVRGVGGFSHLCRRYLCGLLSSPLAAYGHDRLQYPVREIAAVSIVFGLFVVLLLQRDGAYRGGGSLLQIRETERAIRIPAQVAAPLTSIQLPFESELFLRAISYCAHPDSALADPPEADVFVDHPDTARQRVRHRPGSCLWGG